MFDYFYHGAMRKLVIGFGSLFDEIYISRKDAENNEIKKIKVPLSYGPKEKWYRAVKELTEAPDGRKTVETILPRMSFEITSMIYDTQRKFSSLNKTYGVRNEQDGTISYTYAEVPYNVEFTLNIIARSIDDGYQILEQILPYFTPDFTISMNFNDLNKKIDVPIVLNTVSTIEDYDGDLKDQRRMVTHTLIFTAKSYIFGPIKTSGLIREIELTFQELTGEE
jgi:hypothetical protein